MIYHYVKLLLLNIFVCWHLFSQAQSIGIGTATPSSSAILDLTSNTKGLLAPRMTSLQRTGIGNPAKGLLVYDTDVNALYHFNGSVWALVGPNGSSEFALPYAGSVNVASPGFKVINAGIGPAIQAITTNEYGYALQASTTSNYGYGVYAYSRSPNGIGVYGFADSAIAIKAESARHFGIDAISTDSSAIRARIAKGANNDPAILASHAGIGNAVQGTSASAAGVYGNSGASASGYAGVVGFNTNSTSGYGVLGIAHAGNSSGVYGSSNNGTGVTGYSNTKYGVLGSTISGTALYGNSTSGYALETVGKVRLAGANTNPVAGGVLTSEDGSGNAVWKPSSIAFSVRNAANLYVTANVVRKLEFMSPDFNSPVDCVSPYSGTVSTSSSVFTAPTSGVYHFSSAVVLHLNSSIYSFKNGSIKLMVNGIEALSCEGSIINMQDGSGLTLQINGYVSLIANDKVYIAVKQTNTGDQSVGTTFENGKNEWFSGQLVYAY